MILIDAGSLITSAVRLDSCVPVSGAVIVAKNAVRCCFPVKDPPNRERDLACCTRST